MRIVEPDVLHLVVYSLHCELARAGKLDKCSTKCVTGKVEARVATRFGWIALEAEGEPDDWISGAAECGGTELGSGKPEYDKSDDKKESLANSHGIEKVVNSTSVSRKHFPNV